MPEGLYIPFDHIFLLVPQSRMIERDSLKYFLFKVDFFDPTFDSDMIFGGCGALIFVIDAQVDISFNFLAKIVFFKVFNDPSQIFIPFAKFQF
jgi:hypothetical protein